MFCKCCIRVHESLYFYQMVLEIACDFFFVNKASFPKGRALWVTSAGRELMYLISITAVQSKKAVCANIKHNRYFHLTSNFKLIHSMVKDCMDICLI